MADARRRALIDERIQLHPVYGHSRGQWGAQTGRPELLKSQCGVGESQLVAGELRRRNVPIGVVYLHRGT